MRIRIDCKPATAGISVAMAGIGFGLVLLLTPLAAAQNPNPAVLPEAVNPAPPIFFYVVTDGRSFRIWAAPEAEDQLFGPLSWTLSLKLHSKVPL